MIRVKVNSQNNIDSFYGHGKLLITGEYFVLDGAHALAVPTKFGQAMRVTTLHAQGNTLYWVALNNQNKPWLNLVFDTSDFSCINAKQDEAIRLSKILLEARKLSPDFLWNSQDYAVETRLEFPNAWGLGTSSTLIHCVAQWAGVDGYELLKNTIGGSGYDVACAAADGAIIYHLEGRKAESKPVDWKPAFSEQLFFAYLGKKQLSSEAIQYYKTKLEDKTYAIAELNKITAGMLQCTTLGEFEILVNEHEKLVAGQLKLTKVKDSLFADYWGTVKSLGAWGGDFVMLTNTRGVDDLTAYLKEKNISIVFGWNELILNQ
jgi:mevalonate kinase